jgi:hypothetical protein
MDGGVAVGTLPTSLLGAGTEVRAATSKRRLAAVLLGACVIAYTFCVPSLASSAVGWALQAAVRASVPAGAKSAAGVSPDVAFPFSPQVVDPCADDFRGLRAPRSAVVMAAKTSLPKLPSTGGDVDFAKEGKVLLFWYPKADTPG